MAPKIFCVVSCLLGCVACHRDDGNPSSPAPVPPAANLLTNGSLEGGPAIPGSSSYTTLRGGSTAIPGWTVTGTSIDYIGSVHQPSDGLRAVDLDGAFSTGGISQSFATSSGSRYLVTFDLSGNFEGLPRVKQVRVTVADFTQDYTFDTTALTYSNLGWRPVSFSFVATGTTAVITFTSLSPAGNSWGALVDHVAVVRSG